MKIFSLLNALSVAITLLLATPSTSLACAEHEAKLKLPKLVLNSIQHRILSELSKTPHTAVDYYMSIPKSFFNGLDNSKKRRVWYIEQNSLTDSYLNAFFYFDCDNGGFGLEMRLLDSESGPVIAINNGSNEKIYDDGKPKEGDPAIWVNRPRFYRVVSGSWIEIETPLLPIVDIQDTLYLYYNVFKAHLYYQDQEKFIWLKYELSPTSTNIALTGRENFMDPFNRNVWAQYHWTGEHFITTSTSLTTPPNQLDKPPSKGNDYLAR